MFIPANFIPRIVHNRHLLNTQQMVVVGKKEGREGGRERK